MSENLDVFFARFPGFTYNYRNQPELEFDRLRIKRRWSPTSRKCKKEHKDFLRALAGEFEYPTYIFFVNNYPDFDFDSRASPRLELERLRVFRGWTTNSRKYKRARVLFEEAFEEEFCNDLDKFFKGYPEFDYNPRNEPKSEFERLRGVKRWTNEYLGNYRENCTLRGEYREARDCFFEAFKGVFSSFFGISGDLNNWQTLCDALNVKHIPGTAEGCQEALAGIHVNIYDLLGYMQEQTPYSTFPSVKALADYSWEKNLIFPQDEASGTALRFLLRMLNEFKPEKNKKAGDQAKGKKTRDQAMTKKQAPKPGKASQTQLADPQPTEPNSTLLETPPAIEKADVAIYRTNCAEVWQKSVKEARRWNRENQDKKTVKEWAWEMFRKENVAYLLELPKRRQGQEGWRRLAGGYIMESESITWQEASKNYNGGGED